MRFKITCTALQVSFSVTFVLPEQRRLGSEDCVEVNPLLALLLYLILGQEGSSLFSFVNMVPTTDSGSMCNAATRSRGPEHKYSRVPGARACKLLRTCNVRYVYGSHPSKFAPHWPQPQTILLDPLYSHASLKHKPALTDDVDDLRNQSWYNAALFEEGPSLGITESSCTPSPSSQTNGHVLCKKFTAAGPRLSQP